MDTASVALTLARVVAGGKGLEPRFCRLRVDTGETGCKRGGSSFYIYKRQVDSPDTLAEAVGFCHRHLELVRLIL
jgi:hypothetical protein